MPLSFSNAVSPFGTNPLQSALNKKLQPQSLSSLAAANPNAKNIAQGLKINSAGQVVKKPAATSPAPAATSAAPQRTASGGTVEYINGGAVYSNPLDNPNYKAPAAAPAPYVLPAQQEAAKKTKEKSEAAAAKEEKPSFGGILFDLLKKATEGDKTVAKAREDLTKFQQSVSDYRADIYSDPVSARVMQGRDQAVQQANAEKERALQTGVENALADQGQRLTALGAAAGLAQPVQVPYSNQFMDPQTGLPIGGGAGGGSLNDAVSNIAAKVKNGSMSYDAGVQALSGYGQGGLNALQAALGPNFNIQQSNALAAAQEASTLQTGTLGGQLQKQAETVKTHMTTLQDSYNKLQAKYGIPLLNAGINAVAAQFGSGALQSYNIALSNVRDELAKILGGGTSTDGTRATARELLPDNMTPAQLQASIATATELMNSKIAEYTKTPSFSAPGSTGGGGIWDW